LSMSTSTFPHNTTKIMRKPRRASSDGSITTRSRLNSLEGDQSDKSLYSLLLRDAPPQTIGVEIQEKEFGDDEPDQRLYAMLLRHGRPADRVEECRDEDEAGYQMSTNDESKKRRPAGVSNATREMLLRHSRPKGRNEDDEGYRTPTNENSKDTTPTNENSKDTPKESHFRLRRGHTHFFPESKPTPVPSVPISPKKDEKKAEKANEGKDKPGNASIGVISQLSTLTSPPGSPKSSPRMFRRLEKLRKLKPKKVSSAAEKLLGTDLSLLEKAVPRSRRFSSARLRVTKSFLGRTQSPDESDASAQLRNKMKADKLSKESAVMAKCESKQLTYRERVAKNLAKSKSKRF
jgi:hypothetical protein